MFHLWKVVKQWLQCSVFCDVAFSHLQHCEEQPLPLPPALSQPPSLPLSTFFSPLPLLCLLSLPFTAATLGSLGCSTLPHTVRGASLFTLFLSLCVSVSLFLPLRVCNFYTLLNLPNVHRTSLGINLLPGLKSTAAALRLALEMRLSLLYH